MQGIDVFTTLNVQHLETLNDVVAQFTGVHLLETVPDTVLERADEVELVDLPPDELLRTLSRRGRSISPGRSRRTRGRFFRKGNLVALRNWRCGTPPGRGRPDAAVHGIRRHSGDLGRRRPAPGVCGAGRAFRAAHPLHPAHGGASGASWVALYVESPRPFKFSSPTESCRREPPPGRKSGWGTAVIEGDGRVDEDILAFARGRNITQIVMGKPSRPKWMTSSLDPRGRPHPPERRHRHLRHHGRRKKGAGPPAGLRPRITSSPRNLPCSALWRWGSRRSSRVWCSVGLSWLTS